MDIKSNRPNDNGQTGWHGTTIAALAKDGIDWRSIPDRVGQPLSESPDWVLGREIEARLRDVIERANAVLAKVELAQLSYDLGTLGASAPNLVEGTDTTWRAAQALDAIRAALLILGEADPPDPEREGVAG